MGIIGKAVEFLASDALADVLDKPIKALDKATARMKAKDEEKLKKLFECPPGEKALLINQAMYTWRDRFSVYDNHENVKYTVKGEFTSIKRHLHIFDSNGKEIGFVKEKLLTVRPAAIMQTDPIDFDFKINGKKVATLKSRWAFNKKKYSMNNGWEIEGNIVGWNYKILSDGREIAKITMKPLYWGDTYLITFPEGENELLMLMVVLAMDIDTSATKMEVLKDTIHYKSNGWL